MSAIDYASAKSVFAEIYLKGVWGNGSGASSPAVTRPYMEFLQTFMRLNHVRSVVDVGCGDWQFSRELDWSNIDYKGFDVVSSVIETNNASFRKTNIQFCTLGAISDLPQADMVICKDVLQHLPIGDVKSYLTYFSTQYRYALITNDSAALNKREGCVEPVPDEWINCDIPHGGWRPIQIQRAPFNRRSATVLQWIIDAPTMQWTKAVSLIINGEELAIAKRPLLQRDRSSDYNHNEFSE